MKLPRHSQLGRSLLICLGGGLGVVLTGYICFRIGLDFATAGFTLLILTSLVSLTGWFIDSIVLSIIAIMCLNYFFVPPIFSFSVARWLDVFAMAAFLTTSLIIGGLAAKMRRVAAQELLQTRTALARFARVAALGELTASIAHEVNQPLAGVVSSGNACLRWLASDPPNIEKACQSVNRIIRDANRASDVVKRIRGLVNNAPPRKAPLNINDAVLEIALLWRHELEQHQIVLSMRLAENVPPVLADRIQVQQVFMNLIGNAVEALSGLRDGPRDLLVSTEVDRTHGVLATVQDTGAGLDPDKLEAVFDAFYTTKAEGMGMGLAICRSIIETHGGRLWARPHHPRGAIFQFALPAFRQEAA